MNNIRRIWLLLALLLVCSTTYAANKQCVEALRQLKLVNVDALQRAVDDLTKSFPDQYSKGPLYQKRLDAFVTRLPEIRAALEKDDASALKDVDALVSLRKEALFANPLLDFDELLFVRRADSFGADSVKNGRKGNSRKQPSSRRSQKGLGLPSNWQGNCALNGAHKMINELAILSPVSPEGKLSTLYKPERTVFVGDVDLHWDADKILFSSLNDNNLWQIFELDMSKKNLRQVTKVVDPGIHNYDPCYLPDGRIIFGSTACLHGVPCVGGRNGIANLHITDQNGNNERRLCYDQEHDWCPTVMNDGRVMYSRWEYTDTAHYFTRLLMCMNPDGTRQMSIYGSNSYWPNSIFYVRPIPGDPSKVIGIISGHHGVARMGELILFDLNKGQHEADGVVQRIPGYGKKVEPIIRDGLVNASLPKFLHPYPLSDKYFLVSAKVKGEGWWGIYLVDVFDNMLLLAEEPGWALFEPLPVKKQPRPPVIPDRVRLDSQDAVVFLSDIYAGPGLKGVPRGSVKSLRIFSYDFGYNRLASHTLVGTDGPWDVHRIIGTVPVEEDGSAVFSVPANTPLAVQPLDSEGKALQIMRSWLTAMPGEFLSCVGCHEQNSETPSPQTTIAGKKQPSKIKPWYGAARGFGFDKEVQPVLDRYCISCHNQESSSERIPNLRVDEKLRTSGTALDKKRSPYSVLHKYVRRPGPENDYHILPASEYYVDTSELIQMLEKGHHGVELDQEAWDRLITWIDLNIPYYGRWSDINLIPGDQQQRRYDLRKLYGGPDIDYEKLPEVPSYSTKPVAPKKRKACETCECQNSRLAFQRE
ncbi:hypothetical protein ACFLS1_06850 [Verrucomicrobiota bacterium]